MLSPWSSSRSISASDFPAIYKELGIDLERLGVVNVDVEMKVPEFPDHWLSRPKKKPLHVTLRYGLLAGVTEQHVLGVLDNWSPGISFIGNVDFFVQSRSESDMVVMMEDRGSLLREAWTRLGHLPNVMTHRYRPHITLAHLHNEFTKDAMEMMHPFVSQTPIFGQVRFQAAGRPES